MKNTLPAISFFLIAGSFPLHAFAQIQGPTTTFNESLSIGILPNTVKGNALGGNFAVTGSGLAATNLFQLDTNGLFTGSNGAPAFTTNLNESFLYNSSARSADTVTSVGLSGAVSSGNYSILSGSASGTETNIPVAADTFSIQNGSASILNVGAYMGKTNSAERTGRLTTSVATTDNSRMVSSTNDQVKFSSKALSSKFNVTGDGVSGVVNGGFIGGQTAASNAVAMTALSGAACTAPSRCAQGGAFDVMHTVRAGQDAESFSATSTNVSRPGYGELDFLAGGTTAGAIGITNTDRSLTVIGGGAGTSSKLTKTQKLTVFR